MKFSPRKNLLRDVRKNLSKAQALLSEAHGLIEDEADRADHAYVQHREVAKSKADFRLRRSG